MPLTGFDHGNIRTTRLDEMTAWYGDVLGLTNGARPDFAVPGAWLYLGDSAVLHLIEADPAPQTYSDRESLRLEHFAFRATGFANFTARLDARGIDYKQVALDQLGLTLLFLRDPDGNRIHIDFASDETS